MQTMIFATSAEHRVRHMKALRVVLAVMGSVDEPITFDRLALKFRQAAIRHSRSVDLFAYEMTGFATVVSLQDAIRRTMVTTGLTRRTGRGQFQVVPSVALELKGMADPLATLGASPVPTAPPLPPEPPPPPVVPESVSPPVEPAPAGLVTTYGEDSDEFAATVLGAELVLAKTLDQFVLLCASPAACWVRADAHTAIGGVPLPSFRLRDGFPAAPSLIEDLLDKGVLLNRETRAGKSPTYVVQTEIIRTMAARGEISPWVYEFAKPRLQPLRAGSEEETGFAPAAKFDEVIRGIIGLRAQARQAREGLLSPAERELEIAAHQRIIDALRAQSVEDERTSAQLATLQDLPGMLFRMRSLAEGRANVTVQTALRSGRDEVERLASGCGMSPDQFLMSLLMKDKSASKD